MRAHFRGRLQLAYSRAGVVKDDDHLDFLLDKYAGCEDELIQTLETAMRERASTSDSRRATDDMSAEDFIRHQTEIGQSTDECRKRISDQQLQMRALIEERDLIISRTQKHTHAQESEAAAMADQLTQMRLELMTTKARMVPGMVPQALFEDEMRDTVHVTARLARALQLRRVLEDALQLHLTLHPSSALRENMDATCPTILARLENLH